MNMVIRSTCCEEGDVVVPCEYRNVAPERIAIGNHVRPILRAEDAMHQDGSVGVGHASR